MVQRSLFIGNVNTQILLHVAYQEADKYWPIF